MLTKYQRDHFELLEGPEANEAREEIARLRAALMIGAEFLNCQTDENARRFAEAIDQQHRVGDYVADYSPISTEELQQPTGAEELFANSKPVNRRD